MLAKIADVVELAGLQVGLRRAEVGQGSLAENLGGDVLDRAIRDLMDEADIAVLTRHDPGDDLAPCDFRVDDGLATGGRSRSSRRNTACWRSDLIRAPKIDDGSISEKRK